MSYSPSKHTTSNKSYGVQGIPDSARSYFYDDVIYFKYRPFVSTAEVLAYFDTPAKRLGQFSIIINVGGILSEGEIVGGVNNEYWFKDGVEDDDLVIKYGTGVVASFALLTGNPGDNIALASVFATMNVTIQDAQTDIDNHILRTDNPHGVTKTQVGLGNADNTADMDKPVSTLTQAAIDLKQNLLFGTGFVKANGSTISYDNTTYEPAFVKNTAFNKNFGTTTGTVAQGDDSRILNGQIAFGWGNHAGLYPAYNGTGAVGSWGIDITGNAATATSSISFSGSLSGDVTGIQGATVVGKINGVLLAGLATGILKNTTTTGVPSIAIAADFPTLNQNTTGSAATLTTPRTISGVSFNGSANITIPASGIINTPSGGIAGTDVQTALNELDTEKANLASPTFTGSPSLPTGTVGVTQLTRDNSTKLATTAYVDAAVVPLNPNFWRGKVWEVDGDSITYGVDATTFGNSYVGLVASSLGVSYTNGAEGGSIIRNAIHRQFRDADSVSPNTNYSLLIGINDLRNSVTNTIEGVYQGIKAIVANRYLDQIYAASTLTTSGTWTTLSATGLTSKSTLKSLGNPLKSTVSGSTLTKSITTDGKSSIVIGTYVDTTASNLGSFSVTIDGVLHGTFDPSNKANPYYYDVLSPAFDFRQPAVYIASGLAAGSHTVVITTLSATEVDIDYVGRMANPASTNSVLLAHVAHMASYDPSGIGLSATPERIDNLNNRINEIVNEFKGYGYTNIAQVVTNNYFTTNNAPDGLHPDNAGHLQIANAFLNRVSTMEAGVDYVGIDGIIVNENKEIGISQDFFTRSNKFKSIALETNSVAPAFEMQTNTGSTNFWWQFNNVGDLLLRNSPSTKDILLTVEKVSGNMTSAGEFTAAELIRSLGSEPQLSLFQSGIKEWTFRNPMGTTRLGIFEDNINERLTFLAGGNIGVGKTPVQMLDVSGTGNFDGILTAPTASAGTSTTQVATTAFVTTANNLKANLASPSFTGTPSLPTGTTGITQTAGDNSTKLATTAFVAAGLASISGNISGTTSYLPKFTSGTAIGNSPLYIGSNNSLLLNSTSSFYAATGRGVFEMDSSTADSLKTIFVLKAGGTPFGYWYTDGTDNYFSGYGSAKMYFASPYLTGTPSAPTASPGTNTTQIATTAFVAAAVVASGASSNYASPTAYAGNNVSSVGNSRVKYIRVGNIVTVTGRVDVTWSITSNASVVYVDLPVASNLTAIYDVIGGGSGESSSIHSVRINPDTTNDRAEIAFGSINGASGTIFYTYSYEVI